jgi:HEAT repeat protein
MEGLALYLSGSGEPVMVYRPDGSVMYSISSTPEYEQYSVNFDYLEKIYGKDTLIRLIQQSIIGADPELLLREGGIQNEMALVERTKAWQNKKGAIKLGSFIVVVIVLGLMLRYSMFQRIYFTFGGANSPEDVERLKDWGLVGGLIRSLRYQNAAEPVLAKHIRLKAAQSLESFGGKHVERAFIQALDDPYIEVVNVAAEALGKRGCIEAGEPLIKAMESHHLRTATKALIEIGDRKFVLPIIRNIWLPAGRIRYQAVDGLRQWHTREDLSEEFQTAILSEEPELRAGAAILIGCLKIDKLRPVLPGLLNDPSDLVQASALVGMAHLPNGSERDIVVSLIQSWPAAVQEKYLQFLSMVRDDEVGAVAMRVYPMLQSDQARLAAIDIIRDCEFDYAMSLLMELIQKDGSSEMKKQAIESILSLEDSRTVPYLQTILDEGKKGTLDGAMIAVIEKALGRLYIVQPING